jgi:hypothetical protein
LRGKFFKLVFIAHFANRRHATAYKERQTALAFGAMSEFDARSQGLIELSVQLSGNVRKLRSVKAPGYRQRSEIGE